MTIATLDQHRAIANLGVQMLELAEAAVRLDGLPTDAVKILHDRDVGRLLVSAAFLALQDAPAPRTNRLSMIGGIGQAIGQVLAQVTEANQEIIKDELLKGLNHGFSQVSREFQPRGSA